MKEKKIIVSACLVSGGPWRYDGKSKMVENPLLKELEEEGRIIPLCPEVMGGLKVPRSPAERKEGRVVNKDGKDVTAEFRKGAEGVLALGLSEKIEVAILKEGSPSCGSHRIYDGNFSGKKIPGKGVTAEALEKAGIKVFNEEEIEAAYEFLCSLEEEE